MIVWKGWGILTPLIVVSAVVTGTLTGGPYGAIGGSLVAAIVNWVVGQNFNRPLREAGVGPGRRHTFFWVPMELWSIAFLAYALLGLVLTAKIITL